MSNALRTAVAQAMGINPDTIDATEVAKIKAAIEGINGQLVDVADRHTTSDTVAIIAALQLAIPVLLKEIEGDPAKARAYLHAHSVGDTSVTYPGLQPAVQNDGVTPAAALGAGPAATATPAPAAQDPLVGEFARLLAHNRNAAQSMLNMIRDIVALQGTNQGQFNLLSLALTYMVNAASKAAAGTPLSHQEQQWVIVDNGGQPELSVQRAARQAHAQVVSQLQGNQAKLRAIADYDDVLNAAQAMAGRIGDGTVGVIRPQDGNDLRTELQGLRTEIGGATTPTVTTNPTRQRPGGTRTTRATTP